MEILIIIGAPRSGTNILRDTICNSQDFITWDCDEINYIWRYGSCLKKSDELKTNQLKNFQKQYIRNKFRELELKKQNEYRRRQIIVEKTCANCLRIEYIYDIFPEAKFVYIKRNPYDSIYSIKQRWKGNISKNYLYKKAKYIPKAELPYYALRYLIHRLSMKFSKKGELPSWGPRFEGIDKYKFNHSLIETCAKQWSECTVKAEESLSSIRNKGAKTYSIEYENFVSNPKKYINEIKLFLNYSIEHNTDCKKVNKDSIGKGLNFLSEKEKEQIDKILEV